MIDFGLAEIAHPGPVVTRPDLSRPLHNWPRRAISVLPPVSRGGTSGFRAPEILLRRPDQTGKIDIWSAGMIMLSCMSGSFPFFKPRPKSDADALVQLARCIGTGNLVRSADAQRRELKFSCEFADATWKQVVMRTRIEGDRREWSNDAWDFLEKCLSLDPIDRLSAKEALAHPFLNNNDGL